MKILKLNISEPCKRILNKIPIYNKAMAWIQKNPKPTAIVMMTTVIVWCVYSISMTVYYKHHPSLNKYDQLIYNIDSVTSFQIPEQYSFDKLVELKTLQIEIEQMMMDSTNLTLADSIKLKYLNDRLYNTLK